MAEEKETYPAPTDSYPKKGSSATGGDIAYSVEARLAYHTPRQVAGHLLDLRWSKIHFEKSPMGVPANKPYHWAANATGLLSYQAAQALRWWFLAVADIEFSCLCIETRIVEHKIEYSYSETAVRAGAVVGGGDRSNIMFDWGKPKAEAA